MSEKVDHANLTEYTFRLTTQSGQNDSGMYLDIHVCGCVCARMYLCLQHSMTDPDLVLTLSLSELTKQLQEGLLSPEDVFYTYLEKVK